MTAASDVINAVRGIEKKSYLELGVAGRSTFDSVIAGEKTGVDILGGDGVLAMSTDVFFAKTTRQSHSYDVVFIDACHDYPQVSHDYNASARLLRRGGVILLHDMVPPNESYTAQILCSDSFKLLPALLAAPMKVLVLDADYGLTLVIRPRPVPLDPRPISYARFVKSVLPAIPFVSLEEMKAAVA